MSRKMFKLCGIVITMAMGALIGWAVSIGNALIPIPVVLGGVGLLYLCKKRVREVIEDERIYRITEKAARLTIQIFGPVIAVAGAILIAISRDASPGLAQAGFTLAYSACALLVLYYIFHIYYSIKFTGKK